jgi:FtsH-binding integral membrane protein
METNNTLNVTNIIKKPKLGETALGSFSSAEQMTFINRVYAWMFSGLIISAFAAYCTYTSPVIYQFVFGTPFTFYLILIAELVAVFYLSRMVHTISSTASSIVFILYSALNGLTLSVVLSIYTSTSMVQVFLITAGIFGIMSLYGYATKSDLTTVGHFSIMALFGLVIAMIVNLFFRSDMASLLLSCLAVVIFILLTAYDTQKLKWLYEFGRTNGADGEKREAITGALTLYLDFINLFLNLLRIFGRRK